MSAVNVRLTKKERDHLALLLYLDNSDLGVRLENKLRGVRRGTAEFLEVIRTHELKVGDPMYFNDKLRFIHIERKK